MIQSRTFKTENRGTALQHGAFCKHRPRHIELLTNDAMSPLFEEVIEATEEAIYNSMLRATTVSGNGDTVEALALSARGSGHQSRKDLTIFRDLSRRLACLRIRLSVAENP